MQTNSPSGNPNSFSSPEHYAEANNNYWGIQQSNASSIILDHATKLTNCCEGRPTWLTSLPSPMSTFAECKGWHHITTLFFCDLGITPGTILARTIGDATVARNKPQDGSNSVTPIASAIMVSRLLLLYNAVTSNQISTNTSTTTTTTTTTNTNITTTTPDDYN